MQINYIAGTNYSSAPSWLPTVLTEVKNFYDKLFTNNITINVTVNWVPLSGNAVASNNLNGSTGVVSSYSTVSSHLASHAGNAIQNEAYSNMPSGVSSVYVAPGEAEILGLKSGNTVNINLNVGSTASWIPDGGSYDPFGAIAHEITETAMGRIGNPSSTPDVMDMFRFSGDGVHDLQSGSTTSNKTAYFSIDGGAHGLGTWNNAAGKEDYGDWVVSNFPVSGDPNGDPVANDAFGVQTGGLTPVSEVDIELMNVLGWDVAVVTSGVWSSATSGQTFNGYTVMSGGLMTIMSGATASGAIYTDANAFNDGVIAPSSSAGADATGFIDGTEVSATVDGGGLEFVADGGYASATKVNAWGSIADLGQIESAIVSAHGTVNIDYGATAYNTSVLSGGLATVYSSGGGNNTSVFSGGTLSIVAGGSGSVDRIQNGGKDFVFGLTVLDVVSSGGSQTIEAGGSAGLDAVSAGGTQTVSHGGVSDVTFVYGAQNIYGVGSGDIVSGSPANQYVESGGSAVSANLEDFGYQYVSSGGYASATTVSSNTDQIVESGGMAVATIVLSGGTAYLQAGATGTGMKVSAGGLLDGGGVLISANSAAGTVDGVTVGAAYGTDFLELLSGGVADNVTATITADYIRVDSGASATGTVVTSHGYDIVYGVASGTTVSSAGTEYVSAGGETTSTTVLGGGTETLASGAIGDGLTVSAGGVLNGPGVLINHNTAVGAVNGVTVGDNYNDDSLELLSGGVASNVTVTIAVDYLQVDSGASAVNTIVMSHGYDVVFGSATGTVVSSGSNEYVSSGGTTSGATILGGGTENLAAGAIGSGLTVSAGGVLNGPGVLISANTVAGVVNGVTVGDPTYFGGLTLESGGIANNVTATFDSDFLWVNSGASATGTVVISSAYDFIQGSAAQTTVSSGGTEEVLTGGTAIGTTVLSGGGQLLSAGGVDSGVTISNGGVLTLAGAVLSSGAARTAGVKTAITTVSGATLSSGAVLDLISTKVLSGGTDRVGVSGGADLTTLSGGQEVVSSGGIATATTVSNGGLQTVLSGGVASYTVVSSGGAQMLWAGGVNVDADVFGGGVLTLAGAIISSGAMRTAGVKTATTTVSGTTLLSGAVLDLTATTVLSGGTDHVTASGVTSGMTLSGGKELVSSGGQAIGTLVLSGGSQSVLSGAVASNTTVSSGGAGVVSAGGAISWLSLASGGRLVDNGQVLISGSKTLAGTLSGSGLLVAEGPGDLVLSGSGSLFTGQGVISGGTIELATTSALGTGSVVFAAAGSAILQIDAADAPAPGGTFANVISNFSGANDFIDLRSIAYVTGAHAVVSGSTLVLHDGGKTYKFTLAGSVGVSTPVSSDGHGGTLIDPQVVSFAHTMAGFPPNGAGTSPTVSNGLVASSTPLIATGSGAA